MTLVHKVYISAINATNPAINAANPKITFMSSDSNVSSILEKIDYNRIHFNPTRKFTIKSMISSDIETGNEEEVMYIEDSNGNISFEYCGIKLEVMKTFVAILCIINAELKKSKT